MKARQLSLLFCLALSLCIAGCNGCRSGGGSYVTKDKIEGYKGKAKQNPYLATQRFIEEISTGETSVRSGFVKYESRLGMVISPATTLNTKVVTDKMLQWVNAGGIYVCLLQRGEKNYLDIGENCDHKTDYWLDVKSTELTYLLDEMQIELIKETSIKIIGGESYYKKPAHPVVLGDELPLVEDVEVKMGDSLYKMKLGGTMKMKLNRELGYNDYYDKDKKSEEHRFLGLEHGAGRIYFISDARAFRNPYLGMADHASVLETMVSENYGDIVFSFNKRRGFWSLMGNYAGPALLGLFVLLIVWLWKNMPRFGPLLEVPDGYSRNYLESIKNTGHFLWSHKRYDALLEPLRREIKKRSGMFNERDEASAALIETLSESSGVSEEEVRESLRRDQHIDAASMVRITKNLQTILKSI